MGVWEELGDGVLSIGKPLTGLGIGIWILGGCIIAVAIVILLVMK